MINNIRQRTKGGTNMLQLKNIVKDYVVANNVTHALKGVSINFRRNEFVAILGPSGCGKTTLLNITGGLDRYTSGDLVIEGKSTKNYKDGDWDTYRNHSVGFVFQSYNLITHQSVLRNVELALTISGISKAERKERAEKALELVGLGGLGKKKPNQMSGGQMQRVAIARALVNNPEIVMADEPTGALDSETSVQIMELMKEVAKDRLVIMVTHNPDLAKKYATRIITMKDGVVLDDTNPYSGETVTEREAAKARHTESKGRKTKTSMSFVTATGLSFANLISKIKRTVLVTVAGSIGIIGVSAVLAVSQGVNDFIGSMQNDMLSSYPVSIAEESVDLTSLITGMDASMAKEAFVFNPDDPKVGIDSMIKYLMSAYSNLTSVKTNTINNELMDYIDNAPQDALFSTFKDYSIDPTNNIFSYWNSDPIVAGQPLRYETISLNGLTQRYIKELTTVKGFKQYASYVNLFTDFMKELPGDRDYILSQYDELGDSHLGTSINDVTLVVDANTTMTDLMVGQLGIFGHDEFLNIAKQAIEINDLPDDLTKEERAAKVAEIEAKFPYNKDFKYEELLGKELIYLPQESLYEYDTVADDEILVSAFLLDFMSTNQKIMSLNYDMETDTISGTVVKLEGGSTSFQSVVFVREGEKPEHVTSPKDYVSGVFVARNEEGVQLYKVNFDGISYGGSTYYQVYDGEEVTPTMVPGTVQETPVEVKGYNYKAELNADMANHPELYGGHKMRISSILRLKPSKKFGCLDRGVYFGHDFAEKYIADSNKETNNFVKDFKAYIGSEDEKTSQYQAYVKFDYFDYEEDDQHPEKKTSYATALNGNLSSSFSDLFSSLTGVNYYESDKVHLRSVCGMKVTEVKVSEEVTNYDFEKIPNKISLYPKDFAAKDKVTEYFDKWNGDGNITVFKGTPQEKVLTKSERAELTYTDTVKLIITVINTLIVTVTVALVAFTSLSLVVSCFMIAVITYISVVERTKEIGIIRSVGGRKKDVSRLFIAETFMTGLFSGIFGIAMTYVFELFLNIGISAAFGITGIANLTPVTALIMLGISILLSVLSGLVPSMKASNQDPVIALRSGD